MIQVMTRPVTLIKSRDACETLQEGDEMTWGQNEFSNSCG
jgi:hypothetical protein